MLIIINVFIVQVYCCFYFVVQFSSHYSTSRESYIGHYNNKYFWNILYIKLCKRNNDNSKTIIVEKVKTMGKVESDDTCFACDTISIMHLLSSKINIRVFVLICTDVDIYIYILDLPIKLLSI